MCGIVGYIGSQKASPILLAGLSKLEYRGYDSAGLSVFENRNIITLKTSGRVSVLKEKSEELYKKDIFCGIGHTRWATHGRPDIINCHPHGTENVMIVHNGIIENYALLKSLFPEDIFVSETDTEVIAHILDEKYRKTRNPIKELHYLNGCLNNKESVPKEDTSKVIQLGGKSLLYLFLKSRI